MLYRDIESAAKECEFENTCAKGEFSNTQFVAIFVNRESVINKRKIESPSIFGKIFVNIRCN